MYVRNIYAERVMTNIGYILVLLKLLEKTLDTTVTYLTIILNVMSSRKRIHGIQFEPHYLYISP